MNRPATVFAEALGPDFDRLPPAVRAAHAEGDELVLTGRAEVERGRGAWPRALAILFGFPPEGRDVPVRVTKSRGVTGEIWERRFGASTFRTFLDTHKGRATERVGPVTFRLALKVEGGTLRVPVAGARIGPVPLPRFLLPESDSVESEADGRFRFDIALRAPLTGGLIVRYRGWLEPSV